MSNDLRTFQFINKYARFNREENRRETWSEAQDRVFGFMRARLGDKIDEDTWRFLRAMAEGQHALWAMRVLQMAGPSADRCNVGLYNCAYTPISRIRDFSDALYILMQGTGVGFSVEREYTQQLPLVELPLVYDWSPVPVHTIADSTEGWCDALRLGLESWWEGQDVVFDYSRIRPSGAPLATKGGRASGPEPLRELLTFARDIVRGAAGRRLTPLEVHRIACKIGRIVEVGGVRRAAMLSLSDLDDPEMRDAKVGAFWEQSPELTMANNSVAYDSRPSSEKFWAEWEALARSGSGERGIFNRGSRNKRSRATHGKYGTNPCGEIKLNPRQFCNLTIAVVRPEDTREDLRRKVVAATIMGTLQAACTDFRYIDEAWRKTTESERLLGVDLLGALDNPHTREGSFLQELRGLVVLTNADYADKLGIPRSTATTCIKPAGNSGVLLGTGNSVTGWYAPYFLRRVRVNKIDPMFQFLAERGVPWDEEYHDERIAVFAFPQAAPYGAIMRSDRTALQQLEWWRTLQTAWAEHSVSATIYVRSDEWREVGQWVWDNWEDVTGIAFLPHSDAVYPLAPLEEISEEEYRVHVACFPIIDWSEFRDDQDNTKMEFACTAGGCEV